MTAVATGGLDSTAAQALIPLGVLAVVVAVIGLAVTGWVMFRPPGWLGGVWCQHRYLIVLAATALAVLADAFSLAWFSPLGAAGVLVALVAAGGYMARPREIPGRRWLRRRRERKLAHAAWVARVRYAQDVQRCARMTPDDFTGRGIAPRDWWRFGYELRQILREMEDASRGWWQ